VTNDERTTGNTMSSGAIGYVFGVAMMILAVGYIVGFVTFKISKNKIISFVTAVILTALLALASASGPETPLVWVGWVIGIVIVGLLVSRRSAPKVEPGAGEK
jgi:hypothetical protein